MAPSRNPRCGVDPTDRSCPCSSTRTTSAKSIAAAHGGCSSCCSDRVYSERRAIRSSTGIAGNVVVLPEGLFYGRVGQDDLDPILDDYFDGRLNLERYRGRSAYTFGVQAAEFAVREETGLTGIRDVEILRVSREAEDRWLVTLRAAGREYAAEAWAELGEDPVYMTCHSVTPQRPRRFRARLR